jgi:hypothetical protein
VERWEEVHPGETAMVVLGSREDVGKKVVLVNVPAGLENVKNVENRIRLIHGRWVRNLGCLRQARRRRGRGCYSSLLKGNALEEEWSRAMASA